MTRVAVFIDYQNVYMRARECFGSEERASFGQIIPRRVGEVLVERGLQVDPRRELSGVHVARGMPAPEYSPTGNAAAERQVIEWQSQELVIVTTRPLQYLRSGALRSGVHEFEAREKGIDVVLAVGMLVGAQHDEYDVAVLVSADSDLIPAVDAVRSIGKRCEVAAWRPATGFRAALRIPGVWCHWLDRADYDSLHDPTDYTKAAPTR